VSKSSAPRRALDKAECMRRWHISRFEFVLRVIVPPDVLPDLVSLTIGRGYDTAGIYVFHKLLADFGRGLVGAVRVDYLPLFQIFELDHFGGHETHGTPDKVAGKIEP
jgi:hypothetical protein